LNITLDKNDEQLTGLLTVQLTEADYAPTVDKQIKEYTKRAQVKGFRPGMVPVGMVRKMYGKAFWPRKSTKCWAKRWTPTSRRTTSSCWASRCRAERC
jgi:trigger factor